MKKKKKAKRLKVHIRSSIPPGKTILSKKDKEYNRKKKHPKDFEFEE
jgi:hypothetical protein